MSPEKWLPKFGIVVDGVACGFLINMAPGLAQIECIAADPNVPKEVRAEALKRMIGMMETITRTGGGEGIRVLANLPVMKERFQELGFTPHGEYTLFSKSWR